MSCPLAPSSSSSSTSITSIASATSISTPLSPLRVSSIDSLESSPITTPSRTPEKEAMKPHSTREDPFLSSPPRHRRHPSSFHRSLTTPHKRYLVNPYTLPAPSLVPSSETRKENLTRVRSRTTSLSEIVLDSSSAAAHRGHHNTRSMVLGDRFIPTRSQPNHGSIDLPGVELLSCNLFEEAACSPVSLTPSQRVHNEQLMATLISSNSKNSARTLNFVHAQPSPLSCLTRQNNNAAATHTRAMSSNLAHETIMRENLNKALGGCGGASVPPLACTVPERVLDTPALSDDFYLNLLDWSSTNLLAIGLACSVYVWNALDSNSRIVCDLSDSQVCVTSIKWHADGIRLAVGCDNNSVCVYEVMSNTRVMIWRSSHTARIGSLSWNREILSSGGRDGHIVHHEMLTKSVVAKWHAHQEEVCGLAWSADGETLASGGNDNHALLFSKSIAEPRARLQCFQAAVKALAWCPFQPHLLATGAGSNDRHIRIVNSHTGKVVHAIDTKSQVCSLQWSLRSPEQLISAHGFSINALLVWHWPTLDKIGALEGHAARVLHTALSPDGTIVASAGADETLRFWHVWPKHSLSDMKPPHARHRTVALSPFKSLLR